MKSINPHEVDINQVICSYKDKCVDAGLQCNTCQRNTGRKSYYVYEAPTQNQSYLHGVYSGRIGT